MTQQEFDTLVKRLEEVAAHHPSGYKFRVMLLAMLGYAYLMVMVMLLLIANGLLIYAFIIVHNVLIIKAGLAVLVLTYLIVQSLWVKLMPPEGIHLQPRQAPALFELLDQLRRQLKGPKTHVVLLTNDFNAAIVQHPRLGIFGWQKNYLILGLPLMQALSVPQFTAVLAHEYGHLSGSHGRFGAWIYQIRKTWGQLITVLEQKHTWGSALFNKFLLWYIPFFNAYSFVLARLNEYEADRCSAQVTGTQTAAQALVNVAIKARFLSEQFWPKLYAEADKHRSPPYQPYTALPLAFSSKLATDTSEQWLQQMLQEPTGTLDTHPSLSDRLAALGETAPLPEPVTTNAAQQFLGDGLTEWVQTMNQQWYSQVQGQWEQRHEYLQAAKVKWQELETKQTAATELTPQEAWHHASLTEELFGNAAALPLYQALLQQESQQVSASYAVGRILLEQDDERGIEFLQHAMAHDSRAIVPGCEHIYKFLYHHHRLEEAQTYQEKAQQKLQLDQLARAEREILSQDDTIITTTLAIESQKMIADQLRQHQGIKRAYLVQKALQYLPEYPLYVLGIVRTFGFRLKDDKVEYAQTLAKTLQLPGDFFVVILDSDTKRLHKKMRKLDHTLIYEKGKTV